MNLHGGLGMGYGGLGIGDWAHSPLPNPQSPIPNPQRLLAEYLIKLYNKLKIFFFNIVFKFLIYLVKVI